jgi:hypothetical protein
LALACSTPRPSSLAERTVPEPETDGLKRSAMWLYVTAGHPSGAKPECERVFQVLQEESECKGLLCQPAGELAAEWLENCGKGMADKSEQVSDLQASFEDQAERKPTPCVKEFKQLVTAGCEPDECEQVAQEWATRCGGTEGGVLSTLLVEQVANRNLDGQKKLKLDPRSCPRLAKTLQKKAACATEDACEAAWLDVEAYRARCESDERHPDVATGLAQLSIAVGARQEPQLTLVSMESDAVEPGAVPLSFLDGTGAILGLCHRHPGSIKEYLEVRQRCVGTEMLLARLSKGGDQGALQVAKLTVPSESNSGAYPWLEVVGQAEAAAALGAELLKKDLAAVLAAPEGEAVAKLVQLAHSHGRWIAESADSQKVLKAEDGKLAPLLVKLAEIKVAGAKGIGDGAKVRGLYHRAKTRPFADVRRDGKFALGAATAGFWVDGTKALPEAMKQYRKALEPLAQQADQSAKPSARQERTAKENAAKSARTCRIKLQARSKVEGELETCVFKPCDEGTMQGLLGRWDQADDAVHAALREVDLALAPLGQDALSASVTKQQGCDTKPW